MSTKPLFPSAFLVISIAAPLALAGCDRAADPASTEVSPFPPVERPVSATVAFQYSDEQSRNESGEAETVLSVLGVETGETVADIGAGKGFLHAKAG